jgi:cell division protein FtsB
MWMTRAQKRTETALTIAELKQANAELTACLAALVAEVERLHEHMQEIATA